MKEIIVNRRLFLAVIILTIIFSSFYILDFKAAKSETKANSMVSSYSTGNPQIDFPGRICLHIEGNDYFSKSLRKNLDTELEKAGMEVSITDEVKNKYNSQALLINISKRDGVYTPVYAFSNLNIFFFYTSTGGDVKYFDQFKEGSVTVTFVNSSSREGEKLISGNVELKDSTKGLISQKAYIDYVTAQAAKEITTRLEQNTQELL